ncbi:leukocyte elastase inhibitor-like [Halichoeres trimaculatus]|uniref:leukocyte elastase inhibitor-like n=1 Tax=Halichoeres trimaculatus TaxID=147232 RepID=UPI003D9F0879
MAAPFLAKANSVFNLALFKTLSEKNKTDNIFYSPFSISSALAMVLLGARGNTAEEMSRWLPSLSPTADDVHAKFGELLSNLNKEDAPYALSVANRLYGEQSIQFLQEFLADLEKYYRAELESVDFKNNAEEARVKINTWMEKATQGTIKDLLALGDLDNEAKLVLVNAIYFNAKWERPFASSKSFDGSFRINADTDKPVRMMRQESEFFYRHIPKDNLKVLEMAYKNRDLSMIILLPEYFEDRTTGLEKLESRLTHQNFVEWTRPDKMKHGMVDVTIPKFKLAQMYDLNNVLQEMGMSDAFTSKSDLSGMSPVKDLVLSKVVHKAFVEVNEKGTVAAAMSTDIVWYGLSEPFHFIADHPFLFFIRHNPSSSVLFAGRFCSPE